MGYLGGGVTACIFMLISMSGPAIASEDFDAGSRRFSLAVGSGSALSDNYTVLGLGAGFYPVDGLELGAEVNLWFGGDYDIYEVSPSMTYIFTQLDAIKPYIGVLYRETFIETYDNLSAVGARTGVVLDSGNGFNFRVGVTVVSYQDCASSWKRDCTEVTPEVSVGVTF